jgi:SAM-dependent methyltransferase
VLARNDDGRDLRALIGGAVIGGRNLVAERIAASFRARLKRRGSRPVILVIGGGAIGSGAEDLYSDPDVEVIGADVYASPHTKLVADGHSLPFRDAVFDGVWIQAVLEHVLEPPAVVAEIYRVLKPSGLVYGDTPFMQQVHEAAYDFTRFTLSGHRWLFRRFEEIESGAVGGAGTATVWSLLYFFRALGVRRPLATALVAPVFWIRLLDRFMRGRANEDAACGVFFFGSKSERPMTQKEIVAYYELRS